jgi:tetratricopeptide (TPR) repeat protein
MNKPTDFEAELARIDKEIAELDSHALAAPLCIESAMRYVYRLYQRATLTGRLDELTAAESAIDRLIKDVRHPSDLYFLKANIDFKFHRLTDVRRDLESDAELRDSPQGRALWADLDFQEGRYAEARAGYESVIRDERTWDALARLAHFESKMGDLDTAERLYAEAVDELTAKEMRHYAWLELQRGLLDLTHGRPEEARSHYRRAGRAYSGHWMVEEHTAELLAAEERFDEAVALYQKVVARVPRPEFKQGLGELYEYIGETEKAQGFYESALADYLASAARGEVHYYHHLVDFYADVCEDGAEAVRWALKDLELRDNYATRAALAWALHRAGRTAEALAEIRRALSVGAQDAHLFLRAGKIHRAAGLEAEADSYAQMAAALNPRHQSFHVHR